MDLGSLASFNPPSANKIPEERFGSMNTTPRDGAEPLQKTAADDLGAAPRGRAALTLN